MEKKNWEGYSKQRLHWRNLRLESIVALYWLNCDSLSLAEFCQEEELLLLFVKGQDSSLFWPPNSILMVISVN